MELSSREGEILIPLNSTYGGGNGHGHDPPPHNHIIASSAVAPQIPPTGPSLSTNLDDHVPYKKLVRYRECRKNHAAAMEGNVTDGCSEFMPSGKERTIEALNCSACNCHRNFHRKEVEGEPSSYDCYPLHSPNLSGVLRKVVLGHHKCILPPEALGYPAGTLMHSRAAPTPHQMIMPYNMGSLPSESAEHAEDGGG